MVPDEVVGTELGVPVLKVQVDGGTDLTTLLVLDGIFPRSICQFVGRLNDGLHDTENTPSSQKAIGDAGQARQLMCRRIEGCRGRGRGATTQFGQKVGGALKVDAQSVSATRCNV